MDWKNPLQFMNSTIDVDKLTHVANLSLPEATRIVATALREALQDNNLSELKRLTALIETHSESLTLDFEPLLFYARAIAKWANGNSIGAIAEFRALRRSGQTFKPGCFAVTLSKQHGCLTITDVSLDMPSDLFTRVDLIFQADYDGGDHFSTLPTPLTDLNVLQRSLTDLGLVVKMNTEVRGFRNSRIQAEVVAVLEGDYDLGWSRNSRGYLDLICDLGGVSDLYNINQLNRSIVERYMNINKKIRKELSKLDFIQMYWLIGKQQAQ